MLTVCGATILQNNLTVAYATKALNETKKIVGSNRKGMLSVWMKTLQTVRIWHNFHGSKNFDTNMQ